ncbi:MAG: copper chaperone PCu(A)C [Chloroflexota bacterium]
MKRSIFFLIAALAILLSACGSRQGLTVSDAWARPGNAGGNSAVYFTVTPGSEADTLLSAGSGAAMMVELHKSQMGADGTMMMAPQENVPIPAGEKVAFEPGGLHVMLMGLKNDLNVGETFQVTLKFAKAGDVTVEAAVREP